MKHENRSLLLRVILLAAAALATIPACVFIGRHGGCQAPGAVTPGARTPMGGILREAMGSRTYRLLMAGFFTCGFRMALITNHLPT